MYIIQYIFHIFRAIKTVLKKGRVSRIHIRWNLIRPCLALCFVPVGNTGHQSTRYRNLVFIFMQQLITHKAWFCCSKNKLNLSLFLQIFILEILYQYQIFTIKNKRVRSECKAPWIFPKYLFLFLSPTPKYFA